MMSEKEQNEVTESSKTSLDNHIHSSNVLPPWDKRYYSHSYWTILKKRVAFQTPFFGLQIDKDDFESVWFSKFDPDKHDMNYIDAISLKTDSRKIIHNLDKVDFHLEIHIQENVYRAKRANSIPRIWEVGKITQRYDFCDVRFPGLSYGAVMKIVVWADSIVFEVQVDRSDDDNWDLRKGFKLKLAFSDWSIEKEFDPSTNESKQFNVILTCNLSSNMDTIQAPDGVSVSQSYRGSNPENRPIHESFNAFFIKLGRWMPRSFQGGYRDIREYDEMLVTVENKSDQDLYVPSYFWVEQLANPTGVCAIVCHQDLRPTGIPIQVSKNWHMQGVPGYGFFYHYLPVKANSTQKYIIRLAYGFWGSLPSASHANLCLVGYHGHGTRWEQLAIGCWGETICIDADRALANKTITDIRTIMIQGEDGKKWNWIDAGWGGDWLNGAYQGVQVTPNNWKVAYLSHGPCLSEVQYCGWYGPGYVSVDATVSTLRTDDYARTFFKIRYEFKKSKGNANMRFFELGSQSYIRTPIISWGNRQGLIETRHLDEKRNRDSLYINKNDFDGEGPYWFAFNGQKDISDKKWGKGWRGLCIRSYKSNFSGAEYTTPTFSVRQFANENQPVEANGIFVLEPPKNVDSFQEGDWLEVEITVMTLPEFAYMYYGPNSFFKQHIKENSASWRTVHREALNNALNVEAFGGEVLCKYPIKLRITDEYSQEVKLDVSGGVGAVPIQFQGLKHPRYDLFQSTADGDKSVEKMQSVHGHDYYQVDYIVDEKGKEEHGFYTITFNVLLDGFENSTWILRSLS